MYLSMGLLQYIWFHIYNNFFLCINNIYMKNKMVFFMSTTQLIL